MAAVEPDRNTAVVPATEACRPTTVAIGNMSGWGSNIPGFMGEDLIIRDDASWEYFWAQHTRYTTPPPAMPSIDFGRYVVVAAIQGWQSSDGMPGIYVTGILRWSVISPGAAVGTATILIVDDERSGMLPVITNPYHIVVFPKACLPPGMGITFRHVAPVRGTGVVRGHVYVPANATDWRPLQGARLRLAQFSNTGQVAISGMDGSYFFVNVPPGTHVLNATAPGYQGQTATVAVAADSRTYQAFYLLPGPGAEP